MTNIKKGARAYYADTDYRRDGTIEVYNKIDSIETALGIELTGTLTAGQTTITLTSEIIDSNSSFDFYTSVFGVNPTAVSVSTGSITLTFDNQSIDISVKVVVK